MSFSANNIYEWNIDAQTEYNIMNTLQHMTMVATAYQTSHECSEETIIDILVAGFSGQLKGCAVKTDLNGKVITNDDDKEIHDAVNTLIFTIAQHFIGDPSLWKDRSAELLSNLKCRTLADFRWYRDTFLTRVYTREDSQQPFCKEKFLAGLPRSLGDKVRDKIRSQSGNGDIPYENLSYGQLISYVQKVGLKICQDDKIQRQLAKEKAQTKKDLGSFCEQFGLPACPKQKKKQTSRKEIQDHKPANRRRFPKRRYSHKPSTSTKMENPKQKIKYYSYYTRIHGQDHVIAYTSKHWNSAQLKYPTAKKEVLAIVLCIFKFQSDLLNQNFLIRVDYKSAKDILQKDVKNLASKPIFARWRAISSVFDFDIEYIKDLTPKPSNNYVSKNKFFNVLQMEPEYWDKNPFKATTKTFPLGFHYRPTALNKTRKFYEFILVDTNLVSIKHFKDPKDPNLNTHSTIQIFKVMQPRHYGSNLNQPKKFSAPFDPIGYTYWDYIDTWTNVFWHQNNKYKHSWIYPIKQFPPLQRYAFVKWWSQFDTSKAAPDQVKNWFQIHPEFLKPADPKTSLFFNQKSQLAAFLAGSKSKEILAKNLKEVLHLLQQEEEEEKPSKKEIEPSDETDDQDDDPFYQNEDDCFGISLEDD
ncbi:hypothetical protein JHK87_018838 [Glycine soja]|nr:hypothetical protein JHK87_018838 [Glycine soja]KAG5038139.1 hypothetical protein JHK86_018979 [Glycine max]